MRPILPTTQAALRATILSLWCVLCSLSTRADSGGTEVELIKQLVFIEQHLAEPGIVDGIESPYDVQVSPDGENLYIASQRNNAVSYFARDTESGELSYAGFLASEDAGDDSLRGARSLAVSPDGGYVYVVSMFANSLSTLARSEADGALSFVGSVNDSVGGVDGLAGARSVVISPDGKNLYVAAFDDSKVSVFSRNNSTGAASFQGVYEEGDQGVEELSSPHALAMSPDGLHLYVALWKNQVVVFTRDTSTGLLTYQSKVEYLKAYGTVGTPRAIRISPDGKFVYLSSWNTDSVSVFSRNASTGALTHTSDIFNGKSSVTEMDGPHALSISADGKYLYVAAVSSDAVTSFERNTDTGALTFSQSIAAESGDDWDMNGPISIGTSPDGEHVYVGTGSGTHSLVTFRRQVIVDPPELVVAPVDKSIEEGGRVAFHALAQGVEIEYQWYKNGALLEGEVLPVLTIEAAEPEDDGSEYTIKVSNPGGVLTSEPVTLTVLPPIVVEAPRDLTALDISSSSASLAWTDSSDNETSFEIQRRTVGGEFETLATVLENLAQYVDDTLASSTTYLYRVRAKRVETVSQWSNDAVIESYDDIPQAPVNLDVVEETYNKVVLRWSDRSAVEDGFRIMRRDDSVDAIWENAGTVDKNDTSFTDRGVEPEKTYAYRVNAFNESGNSEYSNSVVALTSSIPVQEISPTTRSIPNDAASGYSIAVTSSKDWEALPDVDWLVVTSPVDGEGDGNEGVIYRALLNESQDERVGKIVVGGIEHTVTQEGSPPFLRISPSKTEVGASGGSKSVSIESNTDWTAAVDSEWVSVVSGQSGSGYGSIALSVSENVSVDSRSVELLVNGQSHVVEQAGVVEVFSVSSEDTVFSAEGGTGTLTIESNMDWGASVSVDWITFTDDDAGTGNAALGFAVSAFEGLESRTAEILVNETAISIVQEVFVQPELAAPEWVRATVGKLGVELVWLDHADRESGYRIRRSVFGEESFTVVGEVDADVVEFFDWGTIRGERYEYSLVAFEESQESEPVAIVTEILPSANMSAISILVAAHERTRSLIAEIPMAGEGELILQRIGFGEDYQSLTFGSKYPTAKYALNSDGNNFRLVEALDLENLWFEFPVSQYLEVIQSSANGVCYAARSVEGGNAFSRGARALGYLSAASPMIAVAFEVSGETALPVLAQGVGSSLARKSLEDGVTSVRVRLYSFSDEGELTLLAENDDWRTLESESELPMEEALSRSTATRQLDASGGEARLLWNLDPACYLVVLEDASSGTGSAMLEVFDVR